LGKEKLVVVHHKIFMYITDVKHIKR